MSLEIEKAQVMFKLARSKGNWGGKYYRLEYFKRFKNLKIIIKELNKIGWIILHKKPNYEAISLNPKYKKEIIEFIESKLPYLKGVIR